MNGVAERPDIETWLPLIRRKCTEVAREYPGYVELEDLVQEVAVWWLTAKPEHLWDYIQDPDKMRLRRSVWRVADGYAKKAKAWFGPEGRFVQARYSGRLVMDLMPVALDPDGLPDGGGVADGGPRAHGNLAEGGDVLASLVDVRLALERGLPDEDQLYLLQVQAARWNYDLLGQLQEVEPDTVRRRVARIAQRCANWLNNEEDEAA